MIEVHDRFKKGTSTVLFKAMLNYDFSLLVSGETLKFFKLKPLFSFAGSGVIIDVTKTDIENIDLVPSTTDLSSADIELASAKNRSEKLRKVFGNSDLSKYDYVLLDCPPSLNVLTVNALIAAHALIIPLQSEFFALEGLSQLLMSVREVRDLGNPDLRIEGVVLTMYDARNRLSLQVEEDARENLGELVFKTVIPRNVRISEAPSFAMPVLSYDSRSKGAEAYRALAQEILARR